MATRRNVTEKTISEAQGGPATSTQTSDTTPAVPPIVIYKLLGFTAAMASVPIGTYFLLYNTILKGNATWSGGAAALMANVVLFAYIIVAVGEDDSDNIEAAKKSKKAL